MYKNKGVLAGHTMLYKGNYRIGNTKWVCLFHNTNSTKKQYKRTLTPYLLNAAKRIIPKKYIFKMEYLSSREEGLVEIYNSIWEKLIDFKKTRKYRETDRMGAGGEE